MHILSILITFSMLYAHTTYIIAITICMPFLSSSQHTQHQSYSGGDGGLYGAIWQLLSDDINIVSSEDSILMYVEPQMMDGHSVHCI